MSCVRALSIEGGSFRLAARKKERYLDLEERINDYFKYCDSINEEHGEIVKPYTLSGLVCHLGFTREEFEKLSRIKRNERIVLRAKAKIEAFIEENALTGELSVNASANSLKFNFGWGDKGEAKPSETAEKNIVVSLSEQAAELAR